MEVLCGASDVSRAARELIVVSPRNKFKLGAKRLPVAKFGDG